MNTKFKSGLAIILESVLFPFKLLLKYAWITLPFIVLVVASYIYLHL